MNVNQISMDRDAALAKYQACISERHADSYEFNQQCAKAYELLAAGKTLLRLSDAILRGGLNEQGLPHLAVARADRKEVYFEWRQNNSVARYCTASDRSIWRAERWPELNLFVEMGQTHDHWPSRRGFALVPGVPADVRPQKGLLKDWFVLWEVDHWAERSKFARAPSDPILLEHVGGDLYAVLAEWDLTEIERAILEGAAG